MQKLFPRLVRNFKSLVADLSRKVLRDRYKGTRLQIFENSQIQNSVSQKVLYRSLPLPLCTPQFHVNGSIENHYLQLMANWGEKYTSPAGIISANNVYASFPIGIYSWNGKVFEDALLDSGIEILTNPKYIFALETIRFRRKKKMSESVLLSLPWHHNFFHWLIEILPRLQLYDISKEINGLPLIMPKSSSKFVKDSLILTGYADRVVFVDDGVYKFEKLHILSKLSQSGDVSPLAVEWLNYKVPKKKDYPQKKRIYVSRSDAQIRYVTNEMDVQNILAEFGFETVVMSRYSLEEQIEIFRGAETIVGSHGAAFANLAFANQASTFIEFIEQGHFSHCFYRLANLKQLKYGFLIGKKDGMGFSIDTDQLRIIIEKALSSYS